MPHSNRSYSLSTVWYVRRQGRLECTVPEQPENSIADAVPILGSRAVNSKKVGPTVGVNALAILHGDQHGRFRPPPSLGGGLCFLHQQLYPHSGCATSGL